MKLSKIAPAADENQALNSLRNILEKNQLCSLATIMQTPEGQPSSYISTAFYCITDDLLFYIITPPSTQHGQNLETNPSVALSVFDSHQKWDEKKQGLQLFGTMKKESLANVPKAFYTYVKKYPGILAYLTSPTEIADKLDSRFYRVTFDKIKIFDEPTFGEDVWITADVTD